MKQHVNGSPGPLHVAPRAASSTNKANNSAAGASRPEEDARTCVQSPSSSNELDTIDALLNIAIKAEYNGSLHLIGNDSSLSSPLSPAHDRQLNSMELAKLDELIVANKALLAPLTEDGPINVKRHAITR